MRGRHAEHSAGVPWWKGAKGRWYVVAQFILFGLIVVGPRSVPGLPAWSEPFAAVTTVVAMVLMVVGATLAVWGALALGANLSVLPYPKEGSVLVESGPYRIVRNPIYSGLIFGAFGTSP